MDGITTEVQTTLEGQVLEQVTALNLGVNNATLQEIVNRVVSQTSSATAQQVHIGATEQLISIPQNLIGVNNPVDIVTQNISSVGLANTLNTPLQNKLGSQLTNNLVTNLQAELLRTLSPEKLKLVNLTTLADTLTQGLTPAVGAGILTALTGFSSSLFGRATPQVPTLNGVDNLFATLPSDEALSRLDDQFASSTASKYLNQARNFDVNSVDNQEKLIVTKVGFTDPSATYPTKEYAGISETNKLAQGDAKGTIVQTKNLNRMKGAKLPGGEAWDQPESAFRGQYPYNKVTQTESGHIIEVDDTPGSERLHIYHMSGTFIEIDANGSMIKRAAGSSYEIIDKNGKISIAGQADISINGACNIFVGNDANIEVEGDTNITCHNDITAQAGGVLNLTAAEEINIASPIINIQAYEEMHLKSNVLLNLHAKEDINLKANAAIYVQSVNLYQTATTSYLKADAIYEKASGSIYNQAGGTINLKGGGTINLDGSATYLQSGAAADSIDGLPAVVADSSNAGVISGRKDTPSISINDPVALTMVDDNVLAVEVEEEIADKGIVDNQKHLIISSGFTTETGLAAPPVAIESSTPQSTQTIVVPAAESLKTATILPGNYNLSPNFTIEMLSNKAIVSRDTIIAQAGLTYGEIVFNLQGIALNCLEPIKKLYPNMMVTSGFRLATNYPVSPHRLGQACDVQFKGASKKDYYDIAVQLAKVLKYDQLLLEYRKSSNNPWIHISYVSVKGVAAKDSAKNRDQVLTLNDDKVYSQGLTNLA